MAEIFINNVSGKLASAITETDTEITLQPGHNFEDPGSDQYRASLYTLDFVDGRLAETNHEIVMVTGLTGDVLTVTRAQEGTTAQAFAEHTWIEHRVTAGSMSALATKDQIGDIGTILDDINGEVV